jgi:uncharacterized damage-inducible protein DinB
MFTTGALIELYRHMEWADSSVWQAVRALPAAAAASDKRLHVLLYHIHMVQHAFVAAWRGVPADHRQPEDFVDLAAIESWARSYYQDVFGRLATLTGADLARPLALPWAGMLVEYLGRQPGETTLGETVFQVTSHSTYHRGQVNVRLRDLGGEPPLVDYIAWLWFDRPAPVWAALAETG